MTQEPFVTLLSWTSNPLETVYSVWEASKTEDELRTPEDIKKNVDPQEIEELFRAVIAQRIPVGEHIDFIFMLENVSVSFREQMVRHRIGVKPSPERLGVDIIPNLAESSWWSQSMRIQDMGRFAIEGKYRMARSIEEHDDPGIQAIYNETMSVIENSYNQLVKAGVPMEDARDLIPLGAHHRISWKINMGALQHIIGKRACWILQLGLWGPIITGMIDELVEKVHPIFREVVTPPCLHGNKFTGCVFMEECRRRLTGDDELPPCPLHLNHHYLQDSQKGMAALLLNKIDIPMKSEMIERAEDYTKFWGRDPYSGELLGRK